MVYVTGSLSGSPLVHWIVICIGVCSALFVGCGLEGIYGGLFAMLWFEDRFRVSSIVIMMSRV